MESDSANLSADKTACLLSESPSQGQSCIPPTDLIQAYQPYICHVIRLMRLAQRGPSEPLENTSDLTQTFWLKLISELNTKLQQEMTPEAFLSRVIQTARNMFVKNVSQELREETPAFVMRSSHSAVQRPDGSIQGDDVVNHYLAKDLLLAIRKEMTEELRLYFDEWLSGMSWREIAEKAILVKRNPNQSPRTENQKTKIDTEQEEGLVWPDPQFVPPGTNAQPPEVSEQAVKKLSESIRKAVRRRIELTGRILNLNSSAESVL